MLLNVPDKFQDIIGSPYNIPLVAMDKVIGYLHLHTFFNYVLVPLLEFVLESIIAVTFGVVLVAFGVYVIPPIFDFIIWISDWTLVPTLTFIVNVLIAFVKAAIGGKSRKKTLQIIN